MGTFDVAERFTAGARAGSTRARLPHPLAVALVVVAMFGVTIANALAAGGGEPTEKRARELAYMVRQDCGSCHGMTLNGGLGPPLSPAALADKPEIYLKRVILNGMRGTAMPGWAQLLSEADADWIASQLRKGMPDAR